MTKHFRRESDGKFFRSTGSEHFVPIVALHDDEEDHVKVYGDRDGAALYVSALKGHTYLEVVLHDCGPRGGLSRTEAFAAEFGISGEPHPGVLDDE